MPVFAIVLAAGKGTRLAGSTAGSTAKALRRIGQAPMLEHLLDMLRTLWVQTGRSGTIVVVHAPTETDIGRQVAAFVTAYTQQHALPTGALVTAVQETANGTAGAAQAAVSRLGDLPDEAVGLVVNADTPLLPLAVCHQVLAATEHNPVFVGFTPPNAHRYGKLVLAKDVVSAVLEADHPDYSACVGLANAGCVGVTLGMLQGAQQAAPSDRAAEFGLPQMLLRTGAVAQVYVVPDELAPMMAGANTAQELAALEHVFQTKARAEALAAGVMMMAPETVFFAYDSVVAPGVTIEPYVVFGRGVALAPGTTVHSFSYLGGISCDADCTLGPFTRVRGETRLGSAAKLGAFVDAKAVQMGAHSSVGHLAYVGNSDIGSHVNIGAGVVTANYDGQNKHKTHIGSDAFIGSQTTLIAPIKVGRGAFVAAGSTMRKPIAQEEAVFEIKQIRRVPRRLFEMVRTRKKR